MQMVFWLPLALSVISVGHYVVFTEENWKLKLLAFGAVGLSLALQLLQVHFVIPLIIQVLVCVWMIIYWKIDR